MVSKEMRYAFKFYEICDFTTITENSSLGIHDDEHSRCYKGGTKMSQT